MNKLSHAIVKSRVAILVLCVLLLIPSIIGMVSTHINYDMLTYLPEDLETVQGQDILLSDFGKGAFSFVIVEGMTPNEVAALTEDFAAVDHVASSISYADLTGGEIPMELLPEKYYDILNSGDATLIAVFFDTSTSADETMQAITEIKALAKDHCYVTGMSALVTELKELCEQEEPVYVAIAVVLAVIAMMIFMDAWLVPLVFLASIGMAIIFNLGTNYFLGEISYITKALSAVLQLAVTMDYSIFLWHSYSAQKERYPDDKNEAMAAAISETFSSVVGSSLTTIAGFLALCFMSYTLGKDLGFVMAKGVVFGVIGCVTILPSLILLLDKPLEKSKHRPLLPKLDRIAGWITKRYWVFLILFVVLMIPALIGYTNTGVYYDMANTLPADMECIIANTKLQDDFDMASTHMIWRTAACLQRMQARCCRKSSRWTG
jgi:predicted RND superfamily exporter protein